MYAEVEAATIHDSSMLRVTKNIRKDWAYKNT